MKKSNDDKNNLVQTGVPGLDEVLCGGLIRDSIYLVEGESGAGKTTLALQFSLEGLRRDESVLYLAFSENRDELKRIAHSHDWGIENLNIREAASVEEQTSSIFHPSEVELSQAINRIKEAVDQVIPSRLVLDSLSELRILGQSSIRYRRALLDLKRFLASNNCTVLWLDQPDKEDIQRSLVDGVLFFESSAPGYGIDRRRFRVVKVRGSQYAGGYHDYRIETGGIRIFPRIVASEHRGDHEEDLLKSGIAELDKMLSGGIHSGSSTLLHGPTGTGKSSVAMLFANSAIQRGEMALYFTFDELPTNILSRARDFNMDLEAGLDNGLLLLQQVDPAELSPGQFAHIIRQHVMDREVRIVVIDSLNGYLHSMPEDRHLVAQLHELLSYLAHQGVSTFLILGQRGYGRNWDAPVDTSYLTDNVILFRFLETEGKFRRAFWVIKQRRAHHDHRIRELIFKRSGIAVGDSLQDF